MVRFDVQPDEPHPNAEQFRQRRELSAGQRLDEYLTSAIAEFSSKESRPIMRGMRRLAHLTQSVVAEMDAKADSVCDRITSAQSRASATIEKFGAVAADIERTADEVEAALGQISNDPTQVSVGS